MATTLSNSARSAACNAIVDLLDAGAGAGNVVFRTSGDVEVATCALSATAFGAASNGVATAASITDDSDATGGTAAKATWEDSDTNIIWTDSVTGTGGGGDIELDPSAVVTAGDTVSVTSYTLTVPAS